MRSVMLGLVFSFVCVSFVRADGPGDNNPQTVRRIPQLGIDVPEDVATKLRSGLDALGQKIDALRKRRDARTPTLLPDVEVFHKAVDWALRHNEFFREGEFKQAEQLLAEGTSRADALLEGKAPWTTQKGLVVRGFRSKIDGSVQPYGLVIPESYTFDGPIRYRMDVWFHGRGETQMELGFIHQRMHSVGVYAPADTIVIHPYGRYSNAFKFAGETDTLEAIEHAKANYRIDDDRVSVRGFSMGGAGCWQFAVHYAGDWFAANPGAGFSETPEFLRTFQGETLKPTWWEKTLWHMYDCTDWAVNLRQCPTVAYSGEIDKQKQAADIMAATLAKQGVELTHVIGPNTAHKVHPDSATIIDGKLDALAKIGNDRVPRSIRFVTYTLKYNRMKWINIDGLSEHWEPAMIDAILGDGGIHVDTSGITAFTIDLPAGALANAKIPFTVAVDGKPFAFGKTTSDRSFHASFHRVDDAWVLGSVDSDELRKVHNLQGPIDDAFMDSFVFVRPTGKAANDAAGKWAASELDRAIEHWRRHFRGDARVVDDTAVTDEMIASANLVLWGDPSSNAVMKKIAEQLPISWTAQDIRAGSRVWPTDTHALIAIYPNPLNPKRYVVLNSSFTFREFAYLNNARQVPMLPDWAVIDLRTPPGTVWPGKVVDADFFDERWQLKPPHAE